MIPNEDAHLRIASLSHPGMSGKNNEDHYTVSAHRLSQADSTPSVLAVLADGIGGHHAGEVAAEIATKTISKLVAESDGHNPLETLEYAIVQAGQEIAWQANANHHQQGMGSTCACAWVIGDRLYIASVGDSRIYLVKDGSIRQLTTDHTWVQEAIEQGMLQPEQARDHPRAHVIRRYLGSQSSVVPDFRLRLAQGESDQEALANQGMRLSAGDRVLLCSDGLTDLVDENEILEILQKQPDQQAVHSLIQLANNRGGHDNITILILEMPKSFKKKLKLSTEKGKGLSRKLRFAAILAASILLLVLIALGAVLYRNGTFFPTDTPKPTGTTENLEWVQPIFQGTETVSLTITPSPLPSETPFPETYTPWPTHTYPPEP